MESILVNPLATVAQLDASSSQLDGVPQDLEQSVHHGACSLLLAAGTLLRLPLDVTATAIVLYQRFWIGAEGGSLREHGARDISAASLLLTTKLCSAATSPRSILTVFAYLAAYPPGTHAFGAEKPKIDTYGLGEGTYQLRVIELAKHEAILVRTIGFQTNVALPHTLCIYYLQTLDVFRSQENGRKVAARAIAHLNTALLCPQLLYLTHQPTALATAAIYLAAREMAVKMPELEWWQVFDCDREELGFIVVAMLSTSTWAIAEQEKWHGKPPVSLTELEKECARRAADG